MHDIRRNRNLTDFILTSIREQRWVFVYLFLAPAACIIEANVVPYALKMLLDTITHYSADRSGIFHALAPALWLGACGWLSMVAIFRVYDWLSITAYPQFQASLRMRAFEYVQRHSRRYFADQFAGSVANKISDMARASQELVYFICWRGVATFSVIFATIVIIGTISPWFSLIFIIWVGVQLSIAVWFARRISLLSADYSEQRSTLNGKIVDVLTNITNVAMFAANRFEDGYIGKQQAVERSLNSRVFREMWKVKFLVEIPTWCMMAASVTVLVKGWQAGWVSAGDFAFVFYAMWGVLHWVWQFCTELPQLYNQLGTLKQAWTVIHPPHEIVDAAGAKPLTITRGEIVFDAVGFHYRPEYNIFADKSLTILGGEKVGLVGFSGSGKTTFVQLILRFYDLESGRILIDGQDIAHVTQDSLREQIAMIPQDTSLFHRSLMKNIRYGRQDATDEEVIAASKAAHCHGFIARLPEGYGSLVGERGIKLSGGQRQRIAIARAMLKNAPILLLDEATSALDSATEVAIKESLATLMKGRTSIVIAHRLSTLADMDRILVFDEGRIVEEGAHAELLAGGGHYAMMWNLQAGGFLPEGKEEVS